jgi:anti-sigma regulatory factor (Ser/Thr protein kinase)
VDISRQRGKGFALVTPGPVVTSGDAHALHTAVLHAFAEGEDAVVCDLAAAGAAPAVGRALLAVADRIAPWPAALLVVVGGRPFSRPPPEGVALADSVPDAVELLGTRPQDRSARQLLEPLLEAPALARAFLRRTLAAWDADGYGDDALLVVDELVANSVLHAGTEIELRFALVPGRLGIAVADRSPGSPNLEHPADAAEHGRGLLLVDAVAGSWHVLPRDEGGKVVRAVLAASPPSTAPAAVSSAECSSAGPRGARS